MTSIIELYVFVLAAFVGYQVITRVPPLLHTPLMSATNAIHGIVLLGAIIVAAVANTPFMQVIGFLAVILGAANVFGGFVVTDRMLEMFKKKPSEEQRK